MKYSSDEWFDHVLDNSGYNHVVNCVSLFLATYSGDILHYEDIKRNLEREVLADPTKFEESVINLMGRNVGFELTIF